MVVAITGASTAWGPCEVRHASFELGSCGQRIGHAADTANPAGERFDGASRCALARAIQLKRATAAGLTVLHVADPGLPEERADSRRAAAMGTLEAHLADVSAAQLRRLIIKVAEGDAVTAVVAEADARDADLIVLGQPEKHRLEDRLTGTTAERVIRYTRRPVLVAKLASDRSHRRVVVAFDRSDAAQRALATALALAPRAEFRLVWTPQGRAAASGGQEAEGMRNVLESAANEVRRRSLYSHARLAIEMREGAPVPVIVSAVQAFDADLLAMGTHGRSGLQTALFGSVARELLAASPCDVLVAGPQRSE
jgi:nucleotide-binding universal stress UspA family protein